MGRTLNLSGGRTGDGEKTYWEKTGNNLWQKHSDGGRGSDETN